MPFSTSLVKREPERGLLGVWHGNLRFVFSARPQLNCPALISNLLAGGETRDLQHLLARGLYPKMNSLCAYQFSRNSSFTIHFNSFISSAIYVPSFTFILFFFFYISFIFLFSSKLKVDLIFSQRKKILRKELIGEAKRTT